MKGSEFVRKVKKLARKQGIECKHVKERGDGSHSLLYFGNKRTVVRNLKDALKKGTLQAMLKQLGIDEL
jgi:mRNA interferase HicA